MKQLLTAAALLALAACDHAPTIPAQKILPLAAEKAPQQLPSPFPASRNYHIEVTPLGIPDDWHGVVWSNDRQHIVVIQIEGDNLRLIFDGVPGPLVKGISPAMVAISPDGKRHAFVAVVDEKNVVFVDGKKMTEVATQNRPVFSSDSKHVVYSDGPSLLYDGNVVATFKKVSDIAFSPDCRRLAYATSRIKEESIMVVDGIDGPLHDQTFLPTFSLDSRHVAYFGFDNKDEVSTLYLDGKPQPNLTYWGPILFSPDGKRIAINIRYRKTAIYLDGKEAPAVGAVEQTQLAFSPNSRHFVALGKHGALIDDTLISDFTTGNWEQPIIHFSPDGERVAFAGRPDDMPKSDTTFRALNHVFVDGKISPQYHEVHANSIAFSPDSKHIAYIAAREGREFIVQDGVELTPIGRMSHPPRFSADSNHIAYALTGKEKIGLMVDHQVHRTVEAGSFDAIYLSDDASTLAWSKSSDPGNSNIKQFARAYVENQTAGEFEKFLTTPQFLPNGNFEYFAVKNKTYYRVQHIPK